MMRTFVRQYTNEMEFSTERLFIRPVQLTDAEALFGFRSDPECAEFMSSIPLSVAEMRERIQKTASEINQSGTWFQFVIFEKDERIVVGDIGLHFLASDTQNKQVEVGYILHKKYWGKGYATEALMPIIDYLVYTLDKHRLVANIDPSNYPSIRLVEKLGFRKEGHLRESFFSKGKWVDDLVFAILTSEWKLRNSNNE